MVTAQTGRTESRCHKKPTFLPFISYVLMAHGMTAAGRSSQQPAAPSPDTHINLPLLTALAAPSWLKCPLFAIVDVRPSVRRTQRLILHSLPLPQHSLEGSPPARRSFPRSRNGTSRLGLRGKERRRRRSGGSGGTYSWSVRPSVLRRRRRLELARRQWREGERGAGNGHCLQLHVPRPRCC